MRGCGRGYRGAERADRLQKAATTAFLIHLSSPGKNILSEILLEVGHRAVPRELRCRLVIARRRIVVEAVLRPRVHVHFVAHARRLERLLITWPHLVDA